MLRLELAKKEFENERNWVDIEPKNKRVKLLGKKVRWRDLECYLESVIMLNLLDDEKTVKALPNKKSQAIKERKYALPMIKKSS